MQPFYTTKRGSLYNTDIRDINLPNDIDLVITSPPYNVGIKYDNWIDTMPQQEYYQFIEDIFRKIYESMKDDGRMAINIPYEVNTKNANGEGRFFLIADIWNILQKIGFGWAGLVDLVEPASERSKTSAWGSWLSPSSPYIYNAKEAIMLLYKNQWKKKEKGKSYFDNTKKEEFYEYVFAEWKYQAQTKKHTEANFSLDIPMKALKILSWENDLVLDPFMGSGTTALSCESMNRRWIGTEISEKYCKVAKKRISDMVNKESVFGSNIW